MGSDRILSDLCSSACGTIDAHACDIYRQLTHTTTTATPSGLHHLSQLLGVPVRYVYPISIIGPLVKIRNLKSENKRYAGYVRASFLTYV